MIPRLVQGALVAGLVALVLCAPAAARPAGFNPARGVCTVAGLFSGLAGKACKVAANGGRLLGAGKKLLQGHAGGAVKTLLGSSTTRSVLGLAALAAWATGGSRFALDETAKAFDATTSPRLAAPWFSLVYWRVAGIAVLLTLPFLFAAAIQGLLRSDPSLLARCAFGYLPLAMLGVGAAAQGTALLLTATDGLCTLISSAAGHAAPAFLRHAAQFIAALTLIPGSPFVVFFVAVLTAVAAVVLWTEMVVREAAVYVVVALMPLAFAALVWPARRVWALRAIELLIALILSKLAIVAVLTLGGAALAAAGPLQFMTGVALLTLAAFAPWAMLRLVPFAELASDAAGRVRSQTGGMRAAETLATGIGEVVHDWASATTAQMRRDAERGGVDPGTAPPELAQLEAGPTPHEASDPSIPPEDGPAGQGGFSGQGGPVGQGGPTGADRPAGEDASAGPVSGEPRPAGLVTAGSAPTADGGAVGEGRPVDGPILGLPDDNGGRNDRLDPWLQDPTFDRTVFHLGPDFERFPGVDEDEPPPDDGPPPPQEDPEGAL